MKFGKVIQALIDKTFPEWRDKYLAYKLLKKRLKLFFAQFHAESFFEAADVPGLNHGSLPSPADPGRGADTDSISQNVVFTNETGSSSSSGVLRETSGGAGRNACSDGTNAGERGRKRQSYVFGLDNRCLKRRRLSFGEEFKRLLEEELDKLNDFFLEKEEEYVIRLQDFKERTKRVMENSTACDTNHPDVINLQKDVVVFHGEMVLLKIYSSLNYTGLVKIAKKHDKLTGAWLRLSFIPDVLRQPFYITEQLSSLVRDCESNLMPLFPSNPEQIAKHLSKEYGEEGGLHEDLLQEEAMKSIHNGTLAALQTIQDMGRGSSTYNPFSIPPCSRSNSEDSLGAVVDDDTVSNSSVTCGR